MKYPAVYHQPDAGGQRRVAEKTLSIGLSLPDGHLVRNAA